jgi:hypothetical protein
MEERLTARLDWGIPLIELDDPNAEGNSLQQDGLYFQIEYTPF